MKTKELEYDFIHVTPPMKAPSFLLKDSGLVDKNGFVDVDKYTLNQKFDNVFALGDASNLPTAKTGAGIRKTGPCFMR